MISDTVSATETKIGTYFSHKHMVKSHLVYLTSLKIITRPVFQIF